MNDDNDNCSEKEKLNTPEVLVYMNIMSVATLYRKMKQRGGPPRPYKRNKSKEVF